MSLQAPSDGDTLPFNCAVLLPTGVVDEGGTDAAPVGRMLAIAGLKVLLVEISFVEGVTVFSMVLPLLPNEQFVTPIVACTEAGGGGLANSFVIDVGVVFVSGFPIMYRCDTAFALVASVGALRTTGVEVLFMLILVVAFAAVVDVIEFIVKLVVVVTAWGPGRSHTSNCFSPLAYKGFFGGNLVVVADGGVVEVFIFRKPSRVVLVIFLFSSGCWVETL